MKNLKSIKATIIMGLLLISVFIAITPNSSAGLLINFSSKLNLSWENRSGEPIIPIQEIRPYKLNIDYTVTGGTFGRYLIYPLLFQDKRINIKLTLKDYPTWAIVDLKENTISAKIPKFGETTKYSKELFVNLKDGAPAYETGLINIEVSVPEFKGRFGFIKIDGFKDNIDLSIRPDYIPNVTHEYSNISIIEISPYRDTNIPVNFTNHGNGRTKLLFEVMNYSENWEVQIDESAILEVGEKKTINLYIKTDEKFKEKSLEIKYTPTWAENTEIRGDSKTAVINLINDGSYKEEGLGIEIYALIITVIIIVIIIFVIIFLRIKKRQ